MGTSHNITRYSRCRTALLACLCLAACGGDGAGTAGGGPVPTTPPVDYLDYVAQALDLHNTWDAIAVTDPATLPVGGSARFEGVMGLRFQTAGADLLMNGALQLDVNFAGNSLSGSASGFSDQSSKPVTGSLSVTGGVLDRMASIGTDYTFSANIDGTLNAQSDSFAVTGDIHGDFRGPNGDAAFGIVAGTAASGIGTGYMFGDFISEQ